jgi:hypothetical protein
MTYGIEIGDDPKLSQRCALTPLCSDDLRYSRDTRTAKRLLRRAVPTQGGPRSWTSLCYDIRDAEAENTARRCS